ncbi:hypothetical protein DT076_19090, partial [Desertihabitans brevis]
MSLVRPTGAPSEISLDPAETSSTRDDHGFIRPSETVLADPRFPDPERPLPPEPAEPDPPAHTDEPTPEGTGCSTTSSRADHERPRSSSPAQNGNCTTAPGRASSQYLAVPDQTRAGLPVQPTDISTDTSVDPGSPSSIRDDHGLTRAAETVLADPRFDDPDRPLPPEPAEPDPPERVVEPPPGLPPWIGCYTPPPNDPGEPGGLERDLTALTTSLPAAGIDLTQWIRRVWKAGAPKTTLVYHLADPESDHSSGHRNREGPGASMPPGSLGQQPPTSPRLVRPEHRHGSPLTLDQLTEHLCATGARITIQPVIDPAEVAAVDSYEIPHRIRLAVRTRH